MNQRAGAVPSDHRAADLETLRERALPPMIFLYGASAAVGAWAYLPGAEFRWRPFAVLLAATLGCLLAWWVCRRNLRAGTVALVVAAYLLAGLAALWLPGPVVTAVLALSVAASASLFVPWAPIAAAAGAAGSHLALHLFLVPDPGFPVAAGLYALLGGALAATLNASHQTLTWSWQRHDEARRLADQLRDRQGQLNRTIKALDLAYRLLQRTNHELSVAREEAEEARHLKEQFAANISHELRTPLNLILGFSEMMYLSPHVYGEMEWSPSLRRDVAQVYTASRHLSQLVDDVLDLSRLNAERMPLRKELCDVNQILREVADTAGNLARGRPLALVLDLAEDVPRLLLDRTRMRQVFLNLVNNAIRFTERGEVRVVSRRTEEEVLVSVEDTGVGIPEEELERIFDEFYQAGSAAARAEAGMGLGLAISRRFTQLHGGRVWAESTMGVGSRFHVSLPLKTDGPRTSRLRVSRPLPTPDNPYEDGVLVLGGGPDAAGLLRRHLEGHEVWGVDGSSGVADEVEEHHPRAAIAPLSLAATRRLVNELVPRDLPADVPLLFAAVPNTAWRAELLGVHACLQKPIQAEDLIGVLATLPRAQRVLVVDDDRGFVQMVTRMLETAEQRYAVSWAYSGAEGLEEMRRHRPDVVVLDLLMPGEDGKAVLAAMRADADLCQIPVVLVTAMDVEEDLGGPAVGLVGMVQRGRWGVGDTLAALNRLLVLAKPRYVTASDSTAGMPVTAEPSEAPPG
ncbi:MAG: response regulator [Anaerolineae bacterium]|nr:response regulator [Anaerolineae bacterium]